MASRSLKQYLLASWILPMLLAVGGSAVLSIGISYLDYSNHKQALTAQLHADAQMIARRVAAELLLKENGRFEAVRSELISQFHLTALHLTESANADLATFPHTLSVFEPIPGVTPPAFLTINRFGPQFSKFINLRNLLFALVPIMGLVLSGFLIQRYLLNRYVIRPIHELAETSTGTKAVKSHWPLEIQKIASDLAQTFSEREQAVFGQLAQGLIHDIRTQINSVNTALQLIQEVPGTNPERQARLEKLVSACSRNIPKIRELLDLSLDSSREIVLKPRNTDLSKTLRQSIQNIQELADAKGVEIVSSSISVFEVNHDSLQLERVFTNLIKNAVEAAQDCDPQNRRVEITADMAPSGTKISVEDSGSGFSNKNQIFRPLKTTKAHGHGLGLFVSKKIVQAHLGDLEADISPCLGGAKFTVHLPNKETHV